MGRKMVAPVKSSGPRKGQGTTNKVVLDPEWMEKNAQYSKSLVLRSLSGTSGDSDQENSQARNLGSANSNSSIARELIEETMSSVGKLNLVKIRSESGTPDKKRSPRSPIEVVNVISSRCEVPVISTKHTLPTTNDVTAETRKEHSQTNFNLAKQLSNAAESSRVNSLGKTSTITLNGPPRTSAASYLLLSRDIQTTTYGLPAERSKIIRRGYSDDVSNMMRRGGNRMVKTTSNNSARAPQSPAEYGHVYLNIYDLEAVNKMVNVVAGTLGAGAYHAGVEIYGHEYNFGYTPQGGSGIVHSYPRFHASHKYRKSIDLGKTKYSPREVIEIIERLKPLWPGASYDILRRNCLNFADTFCKELGVGAIPSWVMGLQNKINWTRESIQSGAAKLKQFDEAVGISRAFGSLSRRLTGECTRGKN